MRVFMDVYDCTRIYTKMNDGIALQMFMELTKHYSQVTGLGYPSIACRALVHKLTTTIPSAEVIGLFDYNVTKPMLAAQSELCMHHKCSPLSNRNCYILNNETSFTVWQSYLRSSMGLLE